MNPEPTPPTRDADHPEDRVSLYAPSAYRVSQEVYQGPLDMLLDMARDQKVDLFKVSLATIADEFLAYVRGLEKHDLNEVGDFLVIAGQLLVMKSRALLPTETEEEEEEPIDEQALLIARLRDYERFREVADLLRKAEEERRRLYLREKPPPSVEPREVVEFYEVNVYDLATAFKRVLEEIGPAQPRVIQGEEYTIDEKMAELQILLHETGELCLTLYLQTMRSRAEVIVTFLALLELIRLARVRARQTILLGDIWLHRTDDLRRDSEGEAELAFTTDTQGYAGSDAAQESLAHEAETAPPEGMDDPAHKDGD
ncbi:MAG: Segregation and condensation protein A [bacterium]|nr:Segregation and condensation protein A [bacterium]